MPSLARLAALLGGLVFCASAMAADVDAESYGYPLANPFEATIATTPPELRPTLPADGDIRQRDYSVRLRPDREFELLDNFWPVTKLRYRLAQQNGRAPLIFIISGTGAHYASGTTEYLKKLFYGAGFHVVQLSSPTSYDFMAAASRSATPGYSPDDADDLYRAMQAVRAQHPKLEVSEFLLTGYSLGALHAAFVSQLDETRRAFDFKRVLLLNPPVNLYTSVSNLDKLVQTKVQGIDNSTNFYDLVLGKLTRYFNDKGYLDINEAMLYDFQQSKEKLSDEQMAMLIGTSFRFSSADIVFTSDLLNRSQLAMAHGRSDAGEVQLALQQLTQRRTVEQGHRNIAPQAKQAVANEARRLTQHAGPVAAVHHMGMKALPDRGQAPYGFAELQRATGQANGIDRPGRGPDYHRKGIVRGVRQ